MKKTLLLIDGNSLAYRGFYALHNQLNHMISHEGLHTNALVAFNNFFEKVVKKMHPDYALVAWDAGKTTFRNKIFPQYKKNRLATPSEFLEQIPYLHKLVSLHGIRSYGLTNYEADDIIGTYAKIASKSGLSTTIITGDRDLTQLVRNNILVKVTRSGVTKLDDYTPDFLSKKLGGISSSQVVDMKALTGDNSDNYPGVRKVGGKTAEKLLNNYHSLDGIYKNLDTFKPNKLKQHLEEDKKIAYKAKDLATIKKDAPVELPLKNLSVKSINYGELVDFYRKIDFRSYISKIESQGLNKPDLNLNKKISENKKNNFIELTFSNLHLLKKIDTYLTIYLQTDFANYHKAPLKAFVLGNEKLGYFVSSNLKLLHSSTISNLFKSKIPKYVFDAKKVLVLLKRFNLSIKNITFDFLLVAYLLDTTGNDNLLSTLIGRFGIKLKSDNEVYGKGAKFKYPEKSILFNHLADKASAISRVYHPAIKKLKDHRQKKLYENIELPLSNVLAKMEFTGIKLDQKELSNLGEKFTQKIKDLKNKIFHEAGEDFNINSPKQLANLLFVKKGIHPIKKTKTGFSTAANVLEELSKKYSFVALILRYREFTKLYSTYVKGLMKIVNPDDSKIHTRYLQTLTQTGRLSSVDPNMQNIPDRGKYGKQIRKAFIPSQKGWQIFGADYSQIELRVLAHFSEDNNLIKAFLKNEDIHSTTARYIFHLKSNENVSLEQRRKAKTTNFGIVYGISNYGLSRRLGISRKEAAGIIQDYFRNFPKVKEWIDLIKKMAHKKRYVETISYRRRYLPDINSKNFNLRTFSERTAINTPIQGSAADIIKIAMIRMQKEIEKRNLKTNMLLQIHDELIFETPKSEIPLLKKIVPHVMDSAVKLNVPLQVDFHYGENWFDEK